MSDLIRHRGIVENIDGSCVQIRIVQTSACAGCNARIHCTSADSKEKLVEVCVRDSSSYHVGDSVCVVGEWSMGLKAVSLAFVFPFLILLATLSILVSMECGELVSALVSLTLLIPYYYILWLNRRRICRIFSFSVEPLSKTDRV